MTVNQLEDVLAEIIEILSQYGFEERALWLRRQIVVLHEVGSTPDRRKEAIKELHDVVPGMGGLMDLAGVLGRMPQTNPSSRVVLLGGR